MNQQDIICAIGTAPGMGAIASVRVSGEGCFTQLKNFFQLKNNKTITDCKGGTHHYGMFVKGEKILDEVVINIYKNPHSYTGEDMLEIFCHGSVYIQKEILNTLISAGLRLADPGEFTMRSFFNGKMDLSQAEAVADLISTTNAASHRLAINQIRGGFSVELEQLRENLVRFISLIELELDFSEEDVEFADRSELMTLVNQLIQKVNDLIQSFDLGNVIKNGIPVTIVGETNVGKSTLLNAILKEDKAIVSDIPGTTRDTIEDVINIDGVGFRFIDTAGIRTTQDKIESLGIERTYNKIKQAQIVLLLVNAYDSEDSIHLQVNEIKSQLTDNQKLFLLVNKTDVEQLSFKKAPQTDELIEISARNQTNLDVLLKKLISAAQLREVAGNDVIVTNARHYEALQRASEALTRVKEGLDNNLPGDLLSSDIRQVMNYIGEITGQITNDEILGRIFGDFCIGK